MSRVLYVSHGEGRRHFGVAYPYATRPRRVHKPTGNRPDIWPWGRQRPRRSGPILNTLGSDSIAWGASQVVFYDAMAGRYQRTKTEGRLEIGYPGRHGLPVQHLLRYVILYYIFPLPDRTPGATNWKHEGMGVHVSGSAGVEFPLNIFGQTRDAVWMLPGAWEAEAEWQIARRICRQVGKSGRVRDLERFKADPACRVGVRYGILWRRYQPGKWWGKTERNSPGGGSSCSLVLPLLSDNIPDSLERAGVGENTSRGEAATVISPFLLSFVSCAWE